LNNLFPTCYNYKKTAMKKGIVLMKRNEIITSAIVILLHFIIIVVDHFVLGKHVLELYI
jgi:hypothetical protein